MLKNEKPFSKLKKKIENLFDDKLGMEFCCISYPIRGQWGHSNSVPRFYVKLGKEIIWDFPKDFPMKKIDFGYWSRTNGITALVREYIDTPVNELLTKKFTGDKQTFSEYMGKNDRVYDVDYKLTELFLAADRRLGMDNLLELAVKRKNPVVDKILSKRFG